MIDIEVTKRENIVRKDGNGLLVDIYNLELITVNKHGEQSLPAIFVNSYVIIDFLDLRGESERKYEYGLGENDMVPLENKELINIVNAAIDEYIKKQLESKKKSQGSETNYVDFMNDLGNKFLIHYKNGAK